ncbi:hypothetical protein Efla_003090 [Eimeria flavescens]
MKLFSFPFVAAIAALSTSPLGTAAEEENTSLLQSVMDGLCMEVFAKACKKNPHFCVDAVARFSVGVDATEGVAWRCYSVEEIDYSLTKEGCVNGCGDMVSCPGAIAENSMEHLTRTEELERLLEGLREPMCKISVSPVAQPFDNLVHLPSASAREWIICNSFLSLLRVSLSSPEESPGLGFTWGPLKAGSCNSVEVPVLPQF